MGLFFYRITDPFDAPIVGLSEEFEYSMGWPGTIDPSYVNSSTFDSSPLVSVDENFETSQGW